MQRPSFTIVFEGGDHVDANHLAVVMQHGWVGISYETSGSLQWHRAELVKRIELNPYGATRCPWCDGALKAVDLRVGDEPKPRGRGERRL